jgi:hypothetical protein
MNAISYIRQEIEWGHQLLEMVTADLTPDLAQWTPPGIANPVGALFAHAVLSEDVVVNGMLRQSAPLYASSWAGKSGVQAPQGNLSLDWARGLKPNLPMLREYAKAVYAATNDYLNSLKDENLDTPLDLSSVGLGQRTLGWALAALIAGHLHNMAGEISALKGVQGAKGYPF